MKKVFIPLFLLAAAAVSCTEVEPTTYDKGVSLSTASISFIGDGEAKVVKITSSSPWQLNLDGCDWISASKTEGEATEKIILTAQKNPSTTEAREVQVTVTSGEHTQFLTLSQSRFQMWVTLDRNGETYTCDNLKATETIQLQVTSNTSWTISAPDWVELSQDSGEKNATVTLTVDNSNVTEQFRSGTVRVACTEAEQTFTIEQVCSYANTYAIKSTGTYTIPAARPDGTPLDGAASADWLYMSKDGLISNISYADGRISFSLDSMGGYAVIVLLNGSGEVIWSYTVWATEELEDVQIGADIWMDRNIGAWTNNLPTDNFGGLSDYSAYGCYYQWGRKDPFPGPNQTAIEKPSRYREDTWFSTGTINYAFNTKFDPEGFRSLDSPDITIAKVEDNIRFPWRFTHKGYDPDDPAVQELWSDSKKTIYDPCPAGYKVPSINQTNNMITVLNGWTKEQPFSNSFSRVYSSNGVEFSIPSTAYRLWGRLHSSGRMAGYWTSTFSKTAYAYSNYDFNKTTVDGDKLCEDRHNRGYAVRCVKIQQ